MHAPKKNFWVLWASIFLIAPLFIIRKIKISDKNFKNRLTSIYGGLLPDSVMFCNQSLRHFSWNIRLILEKEFKRHLNKDNAWKLHYMRCMLWRPIIIKILNENNLPEDLFYVCVAESKCSNVISPAGAAGFWQLMNVTAKNYGLKVDSCIDERFHPLKSTKAVCEYFKYLYQNLHDWSLVTLAYNAGLERVLNTMKNQSTSRIDSIKINPETKHFLYRVISIKYLFEHPEYFRVTFPENVIMKFEIKTYSFKMLNDFNKFTKKYPFWKFYNPWIKCNNYYFNAEHQFLIPKEKNFSPSFIFGTYESEQNSESDSDSIQKK